MLIKRTITPHDMGGNINRSIMLLQFRCLRPIILRDLEFGTAVRRTCGFKNIIKIINVKINDFYSKLSRKIITYKRQDK